MQRKNNKDEQVQSLDFLVPPATAAKLLLLVNDYELPLNIVIGKIVILKKIANRRPTKLRRVTIAVEEENEDILNAALVILNIS